MTFLRFAIAPAALLLAAGASALVVPMTSPNPAAVPGTGIAALDEAIASVAATSFSPTTTRQRLLGMLRQTSACFPDSFTRQEWEVVLNQWNLLPPAILDPFGRFNVDTSNSWQGASAQGPATRAQRASLTYSFPDDGVTWGLSAISTTGPNALNASLTTLFGAGDLDEGREYLRHCLAAWHYYGGLDYTEVADANIAMNQSIPPYGVANPSGGGDVRIGGRAFGTATFLAYNAFPSPTFAGVGGSDMVINTSFFLPANFNDSTASYRYLRRTVAHEHGHGLGFIHQVPCNRVILMEPQIAGNTFNSYDAIAVDDRRAVGRNYGDRYSGNQSPATAFNLGNLTTPTLRSAIERDLSTNSAAGFGNTDEDWFRFTIDSAQNLVLTAAPTGGSYTVGQQSSGCTGTTAVVNAAQAGLLRIELYDASGVTLIAGQTAAAAGSSAQLTLSNRPAGTYTVRVIDLGPNTAANQLVQLYDLTVRVGAALARPVAVAGVNKRIAVNTNCWFFGDITSQPTETGATLTAYDWDLDGDGAIETAGAKVFRQYPSNGTYPITLRVTDSNGLTNTDTITLTVFGGTTTLQQVVPANGNQGQTIPVILTGNNLKNLTSAAQVSVSGTGVTVVGTPTPNALGISVSGLSLQIASNAPTGGRNVTVTTADGTSTLNLAFAVAAGSNPCPGDANGDNQVNFQDLAIVLASFGASVAPGTNGDVNGDGVVNFQDLAIVLANFGTTC